MAQEPDARDFDTVGEYAEALIKYLLPREVRRQLAQRAAEKD